MHSPAARRRANRALSVAIAFTCAMTLAPATIYAQSALPFEHFRVPVPAAAGLTDIARGHNGNMWVTDTSGGVSRVTPMGDVARFTSPVLRIAGNSSVIAGPDGNMWFTAGGIGQITPAGVIAPINFEPKCRPTSFLPNEPDCRRSYPLWATVGGDRKVWFVSTQPGRPSIIRVDPQTRTTTEFDPYLPGFEAGEPSQLANVVTGRDGNVWFGAQARGYTPDQPIPPVQIGRITPAGAIDYFPIAPVVSNGRYFSVYDIFRGPDGDPWVLLSSSPLSSSPVGQSSGPGILHTYSVTPTGQLRPRPAFPLGAQRPITGPDGAIWFGIGRREVARMTVDGRITRFPDATTDQVIADAVAFDRRGDLWVAYSRFVRNFGQGAGGRVARLKLAPKMTLTVRRATNRRIRIRVERTPALGTLSIALRGHGVNRRFVTTGARRVINQQLPKGRYRLSVAFDGRDGWKDTRLSRSLQLR